MVIQSVLQPGVEIRDYHSPIMDQELRLFIKLPLGYEDEEMRYPVLFVLDANQSFPIYATLSMIYEKPFLSTQRIIVVGIGYQLDSDRTKALTQMTSWRTRDLTPVHNPDYEQALQKMIDPMMSGKKLKIQTGKAERFLNVINEEIIPFIDTHYRALNTERGLAGYSFGGLFTLYALLHTPETFTRYLAGSPSMWEQLFKYEEDYANHHKDLHAHLFMSAGGFEEDLIGPLNQFAKRLNSRGYPNLAVKTQIFDNENHFTAMPASTTRGLCWHYYPHIIDSP